MTSLLDTKSPLLWRACLSGEVSIINKVMDQGVDPLKIDRNGEGCLHMCARSGEVDAVDRMVKEGLDLDTSNHNGQTPLHVAVSKGHTGVVRFIVRRGASTDLKSKFSGMTALHLSCLDNRVDMTRFLLDNGANCAIRDAIGKYADDYAKDDDVLDVFQSHFPECTHGRRQEAGKGSNSGRKPAVVADIGDDMKTRDGGAKNVKDDVRKDDEDEEEIEEEEDEEEEVQEKSKMSRKEKKRSSKRERTTQPERQGVKIYDKMESYNVDRAKQNWAKANKGGKKIKINHSLGFSDQHKERMSQNVFDRLLKGGGNKN